MLNLPQEYLDVEGLEHQPGELRRQPVIHSGHDVHRARTERDGYARVCQISTQLLQQLDRETSLS